MPVHTPAHSPGPAPLPLDSARTTFAALVAGPSPLSVNGRLFAGLPDRPVPLDELRDRLMRPACPRRLRDDTWRHLVLRSRLDGPSWTVGCVGVALPALASTAAWLAHRYPGDRGDIQADVLTGFLTGLSTAELAQPAVFPRLRWAARRAGLSALHAALDAPVPVPTGYGSAPPAPPAGHPDLILADAVAAGVLSQLEADLIGATRLEEVRLTAWAATRRMGHQFASRLRARAEARLVAWLADNAATDTPGSADGTPPPAPGRSRSASDGGAGAVVTGWLAPAAEGAVLAVWREAGGPVRWRACGGAPAARAHLTKLGAQLVTAPSSPASAAPGDAGTPPVDRQLGGAVGESPVGPTVAATAQPRGGVDLGPAQKVRGLVRETGSESGLPRRGGSPPAPPATADATRVAAAPSSEAPQCA
jgi:hypothetical protein